MAEEVKVVVIGSVGVGKSSLTTRFISDEFNENMTTTLGAAYFEKVHSYGDGKKKVKFQFWDTAGQEKFRAIAKIYYKDAKIAIVMYDVSNRDTFDGLKVWMDELEEKGPKNIIIAVVGNKIDLLSNENDLLKEAQEYADKHKAIFKLTSAKQNKNIKDLFDSLAEEVDRRRNTLDQKKSPSKKIKNKKTGNSCC